VCVCLSGRLFWRALDFGAYLGRSGKDDVAAVEGASWDLL
jgi:hypothetical protein